MQYQINISIDQQSLQQMYMTDENIAFVKHVSSNTSSSSSPVVWVALRPFTSNTIAWVDSYMLYATTTQVEVGATIEMEAESGAADIGSAYEFTQLSQFSSTGNGTAGAISLANQSAQLKNFGLAQPVMVNGMSEAGPTNIVSLFQNMSTGFEPSETVALFLSQMYQNGQVISNIPGNALTITLSNANSVANVVYESGTGRFIEQ